MKKIFKPITNSYFLYYYIIFRITRIFPTLLPDRLILSSMFYFEMGTKLNLKNPQTFNEKLQWLKLNNRKSEMTKMVDKYEVKNYVSSVIGEGYIIPTLGVWNKFEEIDFDSLPKEFVLKTTHDSGTVIICKDKSTFNLDHASQVLSESLKTNFYHKGREWPYKNVQRRIIAEKLMTDEGGAGLKDYKIFNFNGTPEILQLDYDRFIDHKRNLYDIMWNFLDINYVYPSDKDKIIEKPECLSEMLSLASLLSSDYSFLRTDFYVVSGKIYFGELTFYPESGFGKFIPEYWDAKLGKLLTLFKDKFNKL